VGVGGGGGVGGSGIVTFDCMCVFCVSYVALDTCPDPVFGLILL
jgi:hypothetical protein